MPIPGPRVRFDVQYQAAVQDLDQVLKRMQDLRPALGLLVDVATDAYKVQYDTGRGWSALRKSTIAEKGNNRKLVDRGDLREAFVKHPFIRYTRQSVQIGVNAVDHPEAKYLKTGARGMRKRNPAKVNTREVRQRGAETLLAHFLSGGFGGSGL